MSLEKQARLFPIIQEPIISIHSTKDRLPLRLSRFGDHPTLGYKNVYPLGTLIPMKDAGLRIRVQRDLREQFLEVCRAQDKPAAQVIREFMREYVARRTEKAQGVLHQPESREKSR